MKNIFFTRFQKCKTIAVLIVAGLLFGIQSSDAQTYPMPGFTLPNGKTIYITYEADVNANACPNGTIPVANISNQSNVSGSNFTTVQTDDPDIMGASNPTLTPFGALTIGNLVYRDNNKNGIFDAGDVGVNGVSMNLYLDDGDGVLDAGDGAALTTTTTAGGGLYSFAPVCPGDYIVEVAPSNFNVGGPLYDNGIMASLVSSPIGGALDPDNDTNDDDNGDPVVGFGVASQAITVGYGTEPITDGDANANTNLTLDFGFKVPTTVTIDDVTMVEGTGGSTTSFIFTVTRSNPDEAFSLMVNTMDGTAASTSDYTAISGGTVSFTAAGSLTQTVTVLVNHDNVVETNETFTVVLSGAPVGIVITDPSGLGTITNDDSSVITLTAPASQSEGNMGTTPYLFTATLSNPVQGGVEVPFTITGGTATVADMDYSAGNGSVTFLGTAGENYNITVTINGDLKVELDETFTVSLGMPTVTGVTTAGTPATGTITNDDAAVVTISSPSAAENLMGLSFTVSLSNPVDVNVNFNRNTVDGTATVADMDYNLVAPTSSTITAGMTSAPFLVNVINDSKVEADETMMMLLSALMAGGRNVTFSGGGPTLSGTGTILNDDAATVTLTPAGGVSQNEGNVGVTPFVFTATLNNAVQGGFTLAYTTNDGTATVADLDYVDNDGNLIFTGSAGQALMITVNVNGDLNIEPNETFTVALGAITGAPSGVTTAGSPQTGTILNDELDWGDAPTAAQSGFAATYPTTLANNGARHALVVGGLRLGATVDAELDGQPNATASGDGADEDGVTLPASIITGITSNITVNSSGAGILNGWVDFNRDGDWIDVGEQVFTNTAVMAGNNPLSFSTPAGASVGTSFARFRLSTASGTLVTGLAVDGEVEDYQVSILNNQMSIDNPSVVEGNAGTTNLIFTVTRTVNTTASSVDYAITGGTATSGSDYQPLAAGTINFASGGPLTQTITVVVNGDIVVEAHETVIITLSNPVNGGIGANPGTGTITNDDAATITLTGGTSLTETNAGTVAHVFTATLTGDVQGGFTVNYSTDNGTATAPTDYTDNDGSLVFTGVSGQAQMITVLANGDNLVELDETFNIVLNSITMTSAPVGSIAISGSPKTGTIVNDDAAVVAIASNVSQTESTTPQVFTVTLSNPVDVGVTVSFNTSNGTASTVDNDYNGIVNQTVTFSAGTTTSQIVNVTINNDTKVEDHEVYNVAISNLNASGRNVSLGTSSGTGTITNDDAATVTLSGGTSIAEGNSGTTPMVFSATLNNAVQGGFMTAYTTNDGSATISNSDYVDNDGSLTFTGSMGEVKMITVLINGDLNIEPNETFTVALGAMSGATPVQLAAITQAGSPQTGTILNDELDWGDAPAAAQSGFAGTYPTTLANNGARHSEAPGGLRLGATVDADLDGQSDATATGDGADEDGVIIPGAIVINNNATFTISSSGTGFVNAWIDYNRDGDWSDAGEQVITNLPVVAGSNPHTIFVPAGASLGNTFARFRLATLAGATFTGAAADGEVEDYAINVVNTQFSIDDPSVVEGNAGTSNLVFTITRTNNVGNCSVDYAITGGTATTADGDYQPLASGTASFTAGGSLTQTVTVVVNGDTKVELNETVVMTLSNPVNGAILDGSGTGTIVNDDAAVITISSPSLNEPDAGTANLDFTITMSNPSDANVSYAFNTADGTATLANMDYALTIGNQTILAGATMTQISVPLIGDCTIEPNEIFSLILSALNANGRAITFSGGGSTLSGTGTIINEDFPPVITCPPNITISCEASTLPANTGMATAVDDCAPAPTINFVDVITQGNCPNNYVITRTWTATDGTNDMTTCTQVITVIDVTPPSITCPPPVTVQCANLVPAVNTGSVMTSDNCTPSPVVTHVGDVITNQTCFNRYTITRTYRSTDACGNSSTCNQVITVFDNTPPVLTCPGPVTVSCATQVPAPDISLVTGVSDNCSGPAPVVTFVSDVISNQTCFNRFTVTRTYRVTDACGNSATCTQVITVFDNTPPTLTCPAPVTVQCANLVPAVNVASVVTADNCSGPAPVVTHVSDVITNQSCFNRYTITRTYRSTDACGNSATCNQIITVFDNTPPTITCPAPLTVQCASLVPAVNTSSVITADNCGGPAPVVTHVSDVITNQTCINRFTLTRTYRSTDACGNSSLCTQVITVFDNTAPVITFTHPLLMGIPNGGTLEVQCFGQDPMWDPPTFNINSVGVSDNCAGTVTVSLVDLLLDEGDCPGDGYINRHRLTWTAVDACGNNSTRFVFVELIDAIPPVLIGVPEDLTVNCNEIPEPPVVTGTDECLCSCDIVYSQSGPAPGCQNGQVVIRTWTATDNCGNQTIGIQNITLVDVTPPEIIIIQPDLAGTLDGAILNYTCNEGGIPAFFNMLNAGSVISPVSCGNTASITFSQGNSFARNCEYFGYIEQRVYRWISIDQCGNKTSLTITARLIDNESPVLIGVPEIACMGDQALNEIEAIDNCGEGNFRYWDVAIPNPCGQGMAIRRTYEAFDPCGNMTRDTAILIPNDFIPPVMQFIDPELAALAPGETLTVNCDANDGYYTAYGIGDVEVEDDCPKGVDVMFNQKVITTDDCSNGGIVATLLLEWTATDLCGNKSQLSAMVNIVDHTAPEFVNFKGEITIGCNDPAPEIVAIDNCGEVTISNLETIVPGPCPYEYDIVRRTTATDPCGNSTTVFQTIHVGNGSGPVIEGVVPELCDDLSVPQVTAWDPCAKVFVEVNMTEMLVDVPCRDGKVIERVWSATDVCGNVSEVHQTIILEDHTPPEILYPTWSIIGKMINNPYNLVFLSQTGLMDELNGLNEYSIFVEDECDLAIIPIFTLEATYANDCVEDGYYERRVYTWVATDICGNSSSITFSVDIMDDIAPVFVDTPDDITIICQPLPTPPVIHVEDYGQPVNIEYFETVTPGVNPGEFLVTRLWIASDPCGNTTKTSQNILWVPDTFLDCDIILPGGVTCNSHGVIISSSTSGGIAPLTYQWNISGPGFIQSGQGTSSISIYIGFSEVDITLTVTDAFGCSSVCNATLDCLFSFGGFASNPLENVPVAEAEHSKAESLPTSEVSQTLELWPNPSDGKFQLRFFSSEKESVEMSIINLLGGVVLSENMMVEKGMNERSVDLSEMVEGGYLVKLRSSKETKSRMVIITRNK